MGAQEMLLLVGSVGAGKTSAQPMPERREEEVLVAEHRDHTCHRDGGSPAEHLGHGIAGVLPGQDAH